MKTGSGSIRWAVGLWVVLALTMVPHQSWAAQSQSCVSSCGKIPNITHPFRRKDDPANCGDSRYELECVNDVAVLRLSRAEYHVQAINYNNYTIRLVDPNIQEANCSSIPRYFLYKYNFSDYVARGSNYYADVDLYHATQIRQYYDTYDYEFRHVPLFAQIIYMSCTSIVKEYSSHVDNNTTSCLDLHTYVVGVGIDATGWRWEPGCHIKLIAATSGLFELQQGDALEWSNKGDQTRNISYSDIHRALSYGFELSWLHATCPEHNCGSRSCYLNLTDQKVTCRSGICSYPYHSVHECGIRKVIRSYVEDFWLIVHDFLYGMYSLIRLRNEDEILAKNLDHFYTAMEGWYALLSYMAARVLFGVTLLAVLLIYKWRKRHLSIYVNIENFLQDNNLTPIRYSYKEIKKMTKNFKVKLGQGASVLYTRGNYAVVLM